jgi:hypothetical protein
LADKRWESERIIGSAAELQIGVFQLALCKAVGPQKLSLVNGWMILASEFRIRHKMVWSCLHRGLFHCTIIITLVAVLAPICSERTAVLSGSGQLKNQKACMNLHCRPFPGVGN